MLLYGQGTISIKIYLNFLLFVCRKHETLEIDAFMMEKVESLEISWFGLWDMWKILERQEFLLLQQ